MGSERMFPQICLVQNQADLILKKVPNLTGEVQGGELL